MSKNAPGKVQRRYKDDNRNETHSARWTLCCTARTLASLPRALKANLRGDVATEVAGDLGAVVPPSKVDIFNLDVSAWRCTTALQEDHVRCSHSTCPIGNPDVANVEQRRVAIACAAGTRERRTLANGEYAGIVLEIEVLEDKVFRD